MVESKASLRPLQNFTNRCMYIIICMYIYIYVYIYICIYKYVYIYINTHYRRKFRSQTSESMDRWKAEQGRGREKRKIRRKKSRRERVRRKKMQMREKVGKSRNTVFFQWFVAPEGRKVGSLKRRVRSQLAKWEMKNCTPLWREAHFQVKMYKTHQLRTTFTSWGRKSACRCGAKRISKSKCTKHTIVGPLLEVEMSKKCTPLWREAHFQVKMYKAHHVRSIFGGSDVEKVHAVVARSTFRSQNVKKNRNSDHFWRFRCRFASLHYTALHYTTLHYTPLHYITLHSTTLKLQLHNYTPLHSTTFHSTTLHYTTLNYTTLHYTTLHYTTLHNTTTTTTQLHSTTLHYPPLHSTTLHATTLHYTPLHSTTLHYTRLH